MRCATVNIVVLDSEVCRVDKESTKGGRGVQTKLEGGNPGLGEAAGNMEHLSSRVVPFQSEQLWNWLNNLEYNIGTPIQD